MAIDPIRELQRELSGVSRRQRKRMLSRLTSQFGPEFASRVAMPYVEQEPYETPSIDLSQAEPQEKPWFERITPVRNAIQSANIIHNRLIEPWYGPMQRQITHPLAMSVAGIADPSTRQAIGEQVEKLGGGIKSIWNIPTAERERIWEDVVPSGYKIPLGMLYDPTMWYPGWGLSTKALKAAQLAAKKGSGLAKVGAELLSPVSKAEESFIRAANVPIQALGRGAAKVPGISHLLAENKQSIVRNSGTSTIDALYTMDIAGEKTGKTFQQILTDFHMGMPDTELMSTITNPKQRQAIVDLYRNSDKLELDKYIVAAGDRADEIAGIIGSKMSAIKAKELNVIYKPTTAKAVRVAGMLYGVWREMVLSTPWYVIQNAVEDPLRAALTGVNPFKSIDNFISSPSFKNQPLEIQRIAVRLSGLKGKEIPSTVSRMAQQTVPAGYTEAVLGHTARGSRYMPIQVAANIDQSTMMRIYQQKLEDYTKLLMEKSTPETQRALVGLNQLFDDAIKTGIPESDLLESMRSISLTGTTDDIMKAFAEPLKNKTFTVARPATVAEKALPQMVKDFIKQRLDVAWASGDEKKIRDIFNSLKITYPKNIETYQKHIMVERLRKYRDLERANISPEWRSALTVALKKFRQPYAREFSAELESAKSLSKVEQALIDANITSRRELEELAYLSVMNEAISGKMSAQKFVLWHGGADDISRIALTDGDKLRHLTWDLSKKLQHATSPADVKQDWDSFIQHIQSQFPDIADNLMGMEPNGDLLWSAYRRIQNRRWFDVGQQQVRLARTAGVDVAELGAPMDEAGKVLTQEDFIQAQLKALDSWQERAVSKFTKRHEKATNLEKTLMDLQTKVLDTRKSVELQLAKTQNQAKDLALDVMHSAFGDYATKTNLDEYMRLIGVPFWFFPSRSIPFYAKQMLQHPRLGAEIANLQNSASEDSKPSRMFGDIQIPGTNYWYNPMRATMLWQLADRRNFVPGSIGTFEQGSNWMRSMLGISLGPQWKIADMLVSRAMGKYLGELHAGGEPQPLIPQQRWLKALANMKLPVVSGMAQLVNEPFDAYLRAVYGDEIANHQLKEVGRYMVDSGINPESASDEQIQSAWKRYYTRQLISIPGGSVQEYTPTEKARFEAITSKQMELGLTKEQIKKFNVTGESPFTGLRGDQLETIYKDIPSEKLWRYIRPFGLDSKTEPYWHDYIQSKLERENLLGNPDNPAKGTRLYDERHYDKLLESGQISPSKWKSLYRQSYATFSDKMESIEKRYPLAPKTNADWEAYRKMLGKDESIRHPDDITLDLYYQVMDNADFDDEITGEFDYNKYKLTRELFLNGQLPDGSTFNNGNPLSADTIAYLNSRRDKYKSPLRSQYSRQMELAAPYYELYDMVLNQYPPTIREIVERAVRTSDPEIQRTFLRKFPEASGALRAIRKAREYLRKQNPELDNILRFWNR